MKILILHNRYQQRGGEDVCVEALDQLLRERGHGVRLIEADNRFIASPAAAVEAALGCLYSPKWHRRVGREIAEFHPDVAHVHNVFPLLSPGVIYACKAAGVPVVQTLHNYRLMCPSGTLFRDGNVCEECVGHLYPWPGVRHACYRGSRVGTAIVGAGILAHHALQTYTKKVDWFIAIHEFARQKFSGAGLPQEKLVVAPNWLASDPGPGTGDGGYFLFVGRLSPEKGIATLLEAWSRLDGRVCLKIAGAGPGEEMVQAAVRRGLNIEHLGFCPLDEVQKLMQRATALVIPSQWYETGLPQTLAESFAAGTPVIASRLGGLAELVAHGRTGWQFPPCDAAALAATVQTILARPEVLPAMRAAARAEYEAHYTADCGYRSLMEVYTSVIRGQQKP